MLRGVILEDLIQRIRELLTSNIINLGYELYDIEYVKENGEYYLRIYIDSPKGISIDDMDLLFLFRFRFLVLALNECIHAAVEHALELAVYKAGHMAPDMAVQTHGALVESLLAVPVEGNGGTLNEGVAQHQKLRQHRHDQDDGGYGAPSQGLAHGADGGIGGNTADEETGYCHNGTRGQDRGEALTQSFHRCLFALHTAFELQVAVGDDNGVVNGSTHLNGTDHQIAQEKEIGVSQNRY